MDYREENVLRQTAALHQLQTLDSQIDAIQQRLVEIERLLGEDKAVRRAQMRQERATKSLNKWQARLTDLELERRQLREEADSIEKRLYSGKVHNPRELTDLQGKIRELRKRHEDMEDPIIEAMLEIEAGEGEQKAAETGLDEIMAEKASASSELAEEREALKAKLEAKQAERGPARAEVEAKYLATYDRLRERPGGQAVAALTSAGECTSCGMQVTSSLKQNIRRGEVETCPTCGRILYHP